MSQAAKAQEPSMEEILASIRRIIADDDSGKPSAKPEPPATPPQAAQPPRPATLPPRMPATAAPPPPVPETMATPNTNQNDIEAMLADIDSPPPPPAPQDDVLELTESMTAPEPVSPGFRTIDGQSDVVFTDAIAPPEPAPVPEPQHHHYEALREPEPYRELHPEPIHEPRPEPAAAPLLSGHTSAAVDSAFHTLAQTVLVQNSRTLEDLVREMLRPMLKGWLDDNLPGIVERIVRAEIERVSRGRA